MRYKIRYNIRYPIRNKIRYLVRYKIRYKIRYQIRYKIRYKIKYKIRYKIRYKIKGEPPRDFGGTAGSRLGEPSVIIPPYLPLKILSKNPLDILQGYLVREKWIAPLCICRVLKKTSGRKATRKND